MSDRLIYVDLANGNSKFWNGEIVGTTVMTRWGRIGEIGKPTDYPFSNTHDAESKLAKLVASKLKKGYTRQHTMGSGETVQVPAAVKINHNNDPETTALVGFLVQRNIHKIEGMTTIRFESGRLTTPLGPVTSEGLDEAEMLLGLMTTPGADFAAQVNSYLRIVPRNIRRGPRTDPRDLFGSEAQIKQELDTLDSLRAVVKDLDQKVQGDGAPVTFETQLELVKNGDPNWDHVLRFYSQGINRMHGAIANMKLHRLWTMKIDAMDRQFERRMNNVRELWHGTKDVNLLSILKTGYIVPKANAGIAIAGRAFGDGVYFSDQATKSLQYAAGAAPGQYGGGSERKFMLLNDVAMGREYDPRTTFSGGARPGYDSTFAKAGGVFRNNEMIVYRTSQINPKFLCEFR